MMKALRHSNANPYRQRLKTSDAALGKRRWDDAVQKTIEVVAGEMAWQ